MTDVYTVGIWTVKAGREADFVQAWRAMGEATVADFPEARGTLLSDPAQPGRFVSFGPWRSHDEVRAWRASVAFRDGVAAMGELLDGFEPGTYDVAAEVARTTS